jgi:hypothetical protein
MGEVLLFGDCPPIDFQFLQEGPLLDDLVEIKENLGAGVSVP